VIIRYSYMLLYVMRIMNTCIVSLTLIKCYVIVIVGFILLFMIEDVMYCLYKLCFDVEKLTILNFVFLRGQGVNDKRYYFKLVY
jgi:hypothetical protein